MGVGDVIAAVEIVVDVDFPIAIEGVDAAIEVLELLRELQRSDEFGNGAEEFAKWGGLRIEIDENEIFPGVDADRDEAVLRTIEIADALEFDHALEGAVDAVGPAVIRAAKLFGAAVGFGDDGGGVVAADVVEGAELRVVAANDDDGLASDVSGEEFTIFADLIEAPGDLPAFSKYSRKLQFLNAGIAIPGRRKRGGFLQRIGWVVEVQDFADALVHGAPRCGQEHFIPRKWRREKRKMKRGYSETRTSSTPCGGTVAAARRSRERTQMRFICFSGRETATREA